MISSERREKSWMPGTARVDGVTGWRRCSKPLARYGALDGALARGLRWALPGRWSSLKLMVSNQRSRACPLQASSRDDHGPLCRNRRVIGIRERVRCRGGRQDRSREQGFERACGADRLVWIARVWPGADRAGGGAAVAMALCGDEARGSCDRAAGDPPGAQGV